MSTMIAWLHDLRFIDVASAGGKGANLGELASQAFPVPPGFVILTDAYKAFFRQMNLHAELSDLNDLNLDELHTRYGRIRDRIQQTEIAPELIVAIFNAYRQLTSGRNAAFTAVVRSSATAEGLRNLNFAGQHDTYYYVDEAHLLSMIKYCWASLWRPEAVLYRVARRVEHNAVFMAVIVQEMIPAEISGMAWSRNPASGSSPDLLIESGWGMGAAMVDGRMTPDRYIINRKDLRLQEKRIAEKQVMVPFSARESQNGRLQEIPYTMRHQETLSDDLARMIAQWAMKAEELFGTPQEIEWVIANGQVFFLQSRPVADMQQEESSPELEGQYILYPPFAENFSDPLTPLSADLFSRFLPRGLRVMRGRFYYDVKIFRRFFPFHLSDEDVSHVLSGNFLKLLMSTPVAWLKLPVFFMLLLYDSWRLRVLLARTRKRSDDLMNGCRAVFQTMEQDATLDPISTLQRLFWPPGLLASFRQSPFWETVSGIRQQLWFSLLQKLLHFWASDLRKDAAAILSSDPDDSFSTRLRQEVLGLVKEASQSAPLRARLRRQPPEQMLPLLEQEFAEHKFLTHLHAFLVRYGHRAFKEFELQAARWEEHPASLLSIIRNYLEIEPEFYNQDHPLHGTRLHHDLETSVQETLIRLPLERSLHLRWRLFRWIARQSAYLTGLREQAHCCYAMGMYMVRKKILAIEAELISQGKLRCKDDIFFLQWDEIAKLQTGQWAWEDVEDRIHIRHLEHVRLSKQIPLKTVGFMARTNQQIEKYSDPEKKPVYYGQPVSPGCSEGTARVIFDPAVDVRFIPGEILIAPSTSPVWTPLFLLAKAVVIEVGSAFSHAGTCAREYGIPCVVDVAECTTRIHTGDRVLVDGNQGIVNVLL